MLFPFGNVAFLVQTLNLRDLTLFNVDCKCRISHCDRCVSVANTVSTGTGAFSEKNHFNFKVEHKPVP